MFANSFLATSLLLLLSAQAAVVTPRTGERATKAGLAARAFESGSNTCYFVCPSTITTTAGTSALSGSSPGPPQQCRYFTDTVFCSYDADGTLSSLGSATNDADCPLTASDGGCQPTSEGNTNTAKFRRSTRRARVLTRAQKIIKARQFKPKKNLRARRAAAAAK